MYELGTSLNPSREPRVSSDSTMTTVNLANFFSDTTKPESTIARQVRRVSHFTLNTQWAVQFEYRGLGLGRCDPFVYGDLDRTAVGRLVLLLGGG